MRKFLFRIMVFLAPIIVIAGLTEWYFSKTLRKSNAHAESEYPTWNAILDGNINSDIAIYGSSRAWVHVSPTILQDSLKMSVYNFGIDGHNFWLQHLRHKLYLEHNKKPKLIIQTLDFLTLMKQKTLYNPDQFLPYMLWNNEIREATLSYEGYKFFDYEIPLVRYYGKLDAFEEIKRLIRNPDDNVPVRFRGYKGMDRKWNSDFENAKLKYKKINVELNSKSVALFEKYLQECQSKKIKMIFVYTPEFIDGQNLIINREDIMALYRKFSLKYNIPFYDYSNDALSMNQDNFYNALHLNKAGSEKFSRKLAATIKADNPILFPPKK